MSNKKKKIMVNVIIGFLALLAALSVGAAAIALGHGSGNTEASAETVDTPESEGISAADELRFPLDDLQPEIEKIINDVKKEVGGEWSVYIVIPETGDVLSINQQKMQAASVIKLFIMGAVYDEYDELEKYYSGYDIDGLMRDMIVISDNNCADLLVSMLGRGDYIDGMKKVTNFCRKNGFENTSMERLMNMDNIYSDNLTTTEDTAMFLQMALEGKFSHSDDMINLLKQQDRKLKIPAGVPGNIVTANKTGELEDVHNDVAIVYTKYPYIMSVMADGVQDYNIPINAIADISRAAYKYIFALEEETTWTIK